MTHLIKVPVQGAVLNGFAEVEDFDPLTAVEVGGESGHLQNSFAGLSAQTELVDGRLEEMFTRFVDMAVLVDLTVPHPRVARSSSLANR